MKYRSSLIPLLLVAVPSLTEVTAQVIEAGGQPLNLLNVTSSVILGGIAVYCVRANIDLINTMATQQAQVIALLGRLIQDKDIVQPPAAGMTTTTTSKRSTQNIEASPL